MSVRLYKNTWVSEVWNKDMKKHIQRVYNTTRYGSDAEILAKISFNMKNIGCRQEHVVTDNGDYCTLRVYHVPTDSYYEIKVDAEDINKVMFKKWYINTPQNARTLYVANDTVGKMHRYIMNVTDSSILVDHINRDGLDNRKCNLRLVNCSENKKNMSAMKTSTTGINGVAFEKPGHHCPQGRYICNWTDTNGRQRRKTFSVNKYGDDALQMAINYRKQMEEENGYL